MGLKLKRKGRGYYYIGGSYNAPSKGKRYYKRSCPCIKPETKYLTTFQDKTTTATSIATNITAIAQGNDEGQRIGRSINAKYLTAKFSVWTDSAANGSARFLIIQDTMSQGNTIMTPGTFLSTADQNGVTVAPVADIYKPRIKILCDKTHTFSINGPNGWNINVFRKVPFRNRRIEYTSTTSTDVGKNQIYAYIITDGVNTIDVTSCLSVAYTDS